MSRFRLFRSTRPTPNARSTDYFGRQPSKRSTAWRGSTPSTAPHLVPEDEAWTEGRSLIETVGDLELIDPDLSSERLLYRLFHERGVRVFTTHPVQARCTCSRDGVTAMLKSFSQDDRDHMVENGVISVTCEFCSSKYVFSPEEVAAENER